jgi:hypothetical protein
MRGKTIAGVAFVAAAFILATGALGSTASAGWRDGYEEAIVKGNLGTNRPKASAPKSSLSKPGTAAPNSGPSKPGAGTPRNNPSER